MATADARAVIGDTDYAQGRVDVLTMTPGGRLRVDASGSSSAPPAASSAVAAVASDTTAKTIATANANRKGLAIFNDSSAVLTLKLGAGASASSFTTKIAAGGYYEVPFRYTGIVSGLWAAANGNALVTELT